MHAVPLRLAPGSDLRRTLEEFARERNAGGFVLGVVGDLSIAAFQCPGQPEPTVIEGDLEIITLNGTLSPEGVHLHLSLSDGSCQVWGGHLEPGTVVRKGAEILVGLFAPAASTTTVPAEAASTTTVPAAAASAAPVLPAPVPVSAAQVSSAAPPAPAAPVVEIAVLPGCPFSARAQRLLRTLGIPHQLVVVRSAEERASIAQRSGRPTLPQVFIDGQAIGGYDALAELHGQGGLEPLRAI
jgi:predicted DNA-binding protein with PD1-like motif/glutaredoxin